MFYQWIFVFNFSLSCINSVLGIIVKILRYLFLNLLVFNLLIFVFIFSQNLILLQIYVCLNASIFRFCFHSFHCFWFYFRIIRFPMFIYYFHVLTFLELPFLLSFFYFYLLLFNDLLKILLQLDNTLLLLLTTTRVIVGPADQKTKWHQQKKHHQQCYQLHEKHVLAFSFILRLHEAKVCRGRIADDRHHLTMTFVG